MQPELKTRIERLRTRIQEAWVILGLDARHEEALVLERAANAADLWNDPEEARKTLQSLAGIKQVYDGWNELRTQLADAEEMLRFSLEEKDQTILQDLEAHLDRLETIYQAKEFELLFSGPYDRRSAILSVQAGAGGTDAQDWAEMLLRMYNRYAEAKGWSVRLLDESRGAEAGIKSVTVMVEGSDVYGHLRGEAGVHRLVRQSPFNADGLRQTSFAQVEVLPELDDTVAIEIKPDDLRIDTYMSGGKGGQSVNTTYSAVRIVHLPTGITVTCQNERSQTQNRAVAMNVLRAKLFKLQEEERQKEKQKLRGTVQSAEWGSQIRSYVLHPYKMVKDHRTDVETADAEGVLEGKLDLFVEGELRWLAKTEA